LDCFQFGIVDSRKCSYFFHDERIMLALS
jgi:hypothetical protein